MTEHYGYAGKILIVNLTDRTSQTIDTEPYIEWVGGHGMASKLFWDSVSYTHLDVYKRQLRRHRHKPAHAHVRKARAVLQLSLIHI